MTRFLKENREYRDPKDFDPEEGHASAINYDDYKEEKEHQQQPTGEDFHVKQQNRDVEVSVSELPDYLDDYNKEEKPPSGYGHGAYGVAGPTTNIINDEIRGGSGKLIWRRGSGHSGYTSTGSGSDSGEATGKGKGPRPFRSKDKFTFRHLKFYGDDE